ncbi:hypothetical protein COLO4_20319 [Corchorus olitorius]|uniref:Uncharacterized protein n=1 Tax=Corchorus olitorius TaxID=93759 RepID=A0A1R3J0I3_9ROSI|nr:hypothetical protein COLO4_20319 [Corchorus olitorius]
MADPVSIDINEMLKNLSKASPTPCICKVHKYLRQVNERAYDPQVVAIGPYHSGNIKDHLKAMEDQKVWFLHKLLEERDEADVSRYVAKMRELEERARSCYADPISLNSDDFVKLLLLDACFIVQLIRLGMNCSTRDHFSDLLETRPFSDGFFCPLSQDMFLLENQLPFFVLWELFVMIESADHREGFMDKIVDMCHEMVPGKGRPKDDLNFMEMEINHLLDCTYQYCCHPSTSEMEAHEENRDFSFDWSSFTRCATELHEAGIKFQRIDGNTMFDIRFENGSLHIPELVVGDDTEPILRNLIAFEQLFQSHKDVKHVANYMLFIDSLIDSAKDVEILCRNGIIKNLLGDDRAVATMINSLGDSVNCSGHFYYNEVCRKVNAHCSKRWNRRMANLKHNYFNSPWALISVLAATLLLLLTVLQTVFSVLSYAK